MNTSFNKYHLSARIGRKSLRDVYIAYPVNEPEHEVVLKVFDASCLPSNYDYEDFIEKASLIKQLNHPYIVSLLDIGLEEGEPYVVSEYLSYGSLRSHMDSLSSERMDLSDVLKICLQLGQALSYAHQLKVIHGNIKPDNILFDANGNALLADFSLIGLIDVNKLDYKSDARGISYMAPEQFMGSLSEKSDQYALACVIYELLTGQVPFTAHGFSLMWLKHSTDVPVAPSKIVDNLPQPIEEALLKALASEPAERYEDVASFVEPFRSLSLPLTSHTSTYTLAHTEMDELPKISLDEASAVSHLSESLFEDPDKHPFAVEQSRNSGYMSGSLSPHEGFRIRPKSSAIELSVTASITDEEPEDAFDTSVDEEEEEYMEEPMEEEEEEYMEEPMEEEEEEEYMEEPMEEEEEEYMEEPMEEEEEEYMEEPMEEEEEEEYMEEPMEEEEEEEYMEEPMEEEEEEEYMEEPMEEEEEEEYMEEPMEEEEEEEYMEEPMEEEEEEEYMEEPMEEEEEEYMEEPMEEEEEEYMEEPMEEEEEEEYMEEEEEEYMEEPMEEEEEEYMEEPMEEEEEEYMEEDGEAEEPYMRGSMEDEKVENRFLIASVADEETENRFLVPSVSDEGPKGRFIDAYEDDTEVQPNRGPSFPFGRGNRSSRKTTLFKESEDKFVSGSLTDEEEDDRFVDVYEDDPSVESDDLASPSAGPLFPFGSGGRMPHRTTGSFRSRPLHQPSQLEEDDDYDDGTSTVSVMEPPLQQHIPLHGEKILVPDPDEPAPTPVPPSLPRQSRSKKGPILLLVLVLTFTVGIVYTRFNTGTSPVRLTPTPQSTQQSTSPSVQQPTSQPTQQPGGILFPPSVTATVTVSSSPTVSDAVSPTVTVSPTVSPITVIPTDTATPTVSPTPTVAPITVTPKPTPTQVPTPIPTPVPQIVLTSTYQEFNQYTNLTVGGTLDWKQWGLNKATDVDHKANVSPQISDFTLQGNGRIGSDHANPISFAWSDGTPVKTMVKSSGAVYVVGLNDGFRITIPASTTTRTLRLYVGAYLARGLFTASLNGITRSDGSLDMTHDPVKFADNALYTVTFSSNVPNQQLTLTYTEMNSDGNAGYILLEAATLQ